MPTPKKERLDRLLVERGLVESRHQAQQLIMAGAVRVNGQPGVKAGQPVPMDAEILVTAPPAYVSRGGHKLAAALADFAYDPSGKICADVGASTGGFTDALLQQGAARVYAIDVGYGQLAWKLRQDARVVVMERTNARHLQSLPEPLDLVVVDASFISLQLLLPPIARWLVPQAGDVIALIKPQFEAGRDQVGKGGVVRDVDTHRKVLYDTLAWGEATGWAVRGLTPSPLRGPAGNIEFLLWLTNAPPPTPFDVEDAITNALHKAPPP